MLDVIVPIDPAADNKGLLRYAFALARQHGAFVTGLQVISIDPYLAALPEALAILDEEEQAALARRDWWLERCRAASVDGDWEVARGYFPRVVAHRTSLANLQLGRLPAKRGRASLGLDRLSRALFAGTAPTLLVPDGWRRASPARKVVVAWNGSAEAARAVQAAYPLLAAAAKVTVLAGEAPGRLPLRDWLRRRGIAAHWQTLLASRSSSIGAALCDWTTESGADLLVMGAWGHSRTNELILGGTTRYAIGHSQVPLLLAH
ncbi:universal stress protein [Frateuria defendens]|uniref:universal stress protein n=1 Tax=Frateuria defendens TaxID=2219559 RepID=UPI00066FE12D|nr:universal stress protein [Frateuria defendens]